MTTPPVPPRSDFVSDINNAFFDLQPGTTFITQSPDHSEVDTFVVTRKTKVIDGVSCIVVEDTAKVDGELVERTSDYFAQDEDGNVWYFGEDTKEFENGKVVSTEGTWRAGVDGATPGIIMLAQPHVGNQYDQEHAVGVAQDHAQVLSLTKTADVPYGTFDHVLQTLETSPLDAGISEKKHYVAGVGFVLTTDGKTGEVLEQLVKIRVDGTSHDDKLHGYAGGDELYGNGDNDILNGLAGRDTVHGGSGNDLIDGGNDKAADFLYGDSGRDRIHVRTADHVSGGSGNDLIKLFDNAGFGAVDGGSQQCQNLGSSRGDVLQFDGHLDLAAPGLSERIHGIETVSMKNGQGNDSLKLSAHDVLDLGSGAFDPRFTCHDTFGKGDALRVDGNCGDKLSLSGGHWTEINPNNASNDYNVFSCHLSTGDAYVLVQEDIAATIGANSPT